jgi:hypothetical protein
MDIPFKMKLVVHDKDIKSSHNFDKHNKKSSIIIKEIDNNWVIVDHVQYETEQNYCTLHSGKNIKKGLNNQWGEKAKKFFLNAVYNNKFNTDKLKLLLKAFTKHIINDHSLCDENCKYKKSIMPKNKYLDINIKKNKIIYNKIKKIFETKIKEAHMFTYSQNTNLNESFHHALLSETPKGIDYYKTYNDKICISIIKKNWGKFYLLQLFAELKMNINYFCFQKLINIENKKKNKNLLNNSKKIKYENKIKKIKKISIIKKKKNQSSYPSSNSEKIKNNNLTVEIKKEIDKINVNDKKFELIEKHEEKEIIKKNEKKSELIECHNKCIIIDKKFKKRKIINK